MIVRNLLILFFIHFACAQNAPIVNTTQGPVRGLIAEDGGYYMYLGIPYGVVNPANPFGLASPAPAFEGVFDATDDSANCPQIGPIPILIGSIDCLHLNVFVPPPTGSLLPVMVFIHGGAFEVGSFGRQIYGAKFLVRHDIVLVSLNYRLGPYGFMCTDNPRVPGNQALRDQLIALRWIQDNIESFGGDPNRVTLCGSSAGGMTGDLHVIRNADEGLFHQAIFQSGVSFFPSFPPTSRDSPLILAQHFGYATNDIDAALDFLSTTDPFQVISAGRILGLEFRPCIERSFEGVEPFMTENWVMKDVIPTAKDLNIMIGFNQNEALGLLLWPTSNLSNIVNVSLSKFAIGHEDFTGTDEVRKFYFGDSDIKDYKLEDAVDLLSDTTFPHNAIRSMDRYLKSDVGKAYLYMFSYDGERSILKRTVNTTIKGAVHADELGYLFSIQMFGVPNIEDQRIIDQMTTMWANFVKYGDPTPELTTLLHVKWEATTPSQYHYLRIDSELELGTRPLQERMVFWDMFLEKNGHLQNFVLDNAHLENSIK